MWCDSDRYFKDALVKGNIHELSCYANKAELTLIDIPIGLMDKKSLESEGVMLRPGKN